MSLEVCIFPSLAKGGTAGPGSVVTGIDLETGVKLWQHGYAYPVPPRGLATDGAIAASALPGGAVPVAQAGRDVITDLVFGDIYGNVWVLDPATGISKHGGPLFSFRSNYHAIGARPAVLSRGGKQYAVIVSGGYADPQGTTWGVGVQQYAVAVAISPEGAPPLDETSPAPDIAFAVPLGANERGFAQALVLGNEVFITTDTGDVNAGDYGTTGSATGRVYRLDLAGAPTGATVVVAGGANQIARSGTILYTSSANEIQQVSSAAGATGERVDVNQSPKVRRLLWLRLQ